MVDMVAMVEVDMVAMVEVANERFTKPKRSCCYLVCRNGCCDLFVHSCY